MTLRLGVIGAGAWTVASHLPNLARRADEVEFVAVNRRDPDLLESIRRRHGFRLGFTDYRDVLAAGVDICIVASPARWHHEHARAALEAGAHVLVEKPFTIDPADAWDLAETADRLERHLLVAFGANYQPMIREAKRLMDTGGGIGEVEHVAIHMASVTRDLLVGRPRPFTLDGLAEGAPELLAEPGTSADPAISGGGYAQAQLSHAIGLGLWLTGLRGREVYGVTWRPTPNVPVELHDAAVITFENGAIGTISGGSCHWGAGNNKHQQEVRLIGSAGQLHVDVEREIVWRYRGLDDDVRVPVNDGDGLYDCRGPIDALVDLAAGQPVVNASPGELGARVVEVVDALYRSVRSHTPVRCPAAIAKRRGRSVSRS
jgi:predicted dehydrogenase